NMGKRIRLPSSEFTRGGGAFGERGRWTRSDTSKEERKHARSARLTSFMTVGKEGDENQRKGTSTVRLDFPTGRKLKFQRRDSRGDGRGVSVGRALNRRELDKLRQLRDELAGGAVRLFE
ncbi:hypothetical protein P692DRAFT_201798438, partial [Suillus brevipes Sb2]